MKEAEEEKSVDDRPRNFKLAYWWAFGISGVYLLYGAVSLVLAFLDRQYNNLVQPFTFLVIGVVLITVAYAFRGRRRWGWYGEVAINGVIIILALIGFSHYINLVLLVLAGAALALVLSNDTRQYVLGSR